MTETDWKFTAEARLQRIKELEAAIIDAYAATEKKIEELEAENEEWLGKFSVAVINLHRTEKRRTQ